MSFFSVMKSLCNIPCCESFFIHFSVWKLLSFSSEQFSGIKKNSGTPIKLEGGPAWIESLIFLLFTYIFYLHFFFFNSTSWEISSFYLPTHILNFHVYYHISNFQELFKNLWNVLFITSRSRFTDEKLFNSARICDSFSEAFLYSLHDFLSPDLLLAFCFVLFF